MPPFCGERKSPRFWKRGSMEGRIPSWRLRGHSLDPCGTIRASSAWVLDSRQENELGDFSVPGLARQAQDRRAKEDFDRELADASPPAVISRARGEDELDRNIDVLERGTSGMRATISAAPQASLFQTGTGKSVQVSGAAMKRALALLSNEDAATPSKKRSNVEEPALGFSSPGGGANALFQTANGKSVPISSTALNKARSLLGGAESNRDDASKLKGFSTPGFRGGLSRLPASVPPFKQPRRRFTSPMALASVKRFQLPKDGSSTDTRTLLPLSEIDGNKPRAPANRMAIELNAIGREKGFRLPPRVKLREYFQHPPHQVDKHLVFVPKEILCMTSDTARDYKMKLLCGKAGASELRNMLLEGGAKPHLATNEWVENHYRWIVWKLASQQRSYPRKARGFLCLRNVLRELKYRYVKEIENGHRSVLRKICERDASAAHTMILCISAVRKTGEERNESCLVEVTDGWYCLNAALDAPLSKQLKAGKVFVGQKLQISGASLTGAIGGLPPLEAFSVAYLAVHINGTYRAHWADPLGARRQRPLPLAFRCIKADGGIVSSTCIAITRIYPLLYKEKLKDGMFVVRTTRAENAAQMNFEQRRANIAEDVMANFQSDAEAFNEDERFHEGAKLYQLLEGASDPEVVMADMTSEDHAALSAYQARKLCSSQAAVEKHVQKALEHANLHSRDVTPFLKIGVTGLQSNFIDVANSNGSIMIWNPSDTLTRELVEGAAYVVSNLKPAPQSRAGNRLLSANKSSRWRKISSKGFTFEFTPRQGLQLSSLVEVRAYSEFDAAALVIFVGEVYKSGDRLRQWVFVSDGSMQEGEAALLAIDFSASADSFLQFESAYSNTVVGFCNLVKQHPDERNQMWVAEATNLTIYSSKLSSSGYHHLSKPAGLVSRWANTSPQAIECLRHRVLQILSDGT
ncbi:protein BREAST CANCER SUSCEPTIBILITY 2 homolog B-like [Selaginella moellendorffii]|uniref:protein BREAST CANCER SUSCEPTIBILITY 2 homolog B-like n=1 Tax=Selaginella moellendorffii TaxID=88036 RepID=UPI000D1CF172|nr:protein BREAST CANCER SUSCEPTIBILITY 2 homolog B-like [Selaginella moellendorffii]|eukprot:XP_024515241.1 protein BREAST CANCER SUSCEPTIBILITY 2 homolog B-like [Selaginella moellendorffii]